MSRLLVLMFPPLLAMYVADLCASRRDSDGCARGGADRGVVAATRRSGGAGSALRTVGA